MKLTNKSFEYLKNLSKINPTVLLKSGSLQNAISADETVIVEVKLDEDISTQIGIYRLDNLLSLLSQLKDPEIKFSDHSFTVTDSKGYKATFKACAPELINTGDELLEKAATIPTILEFDLPDDVFSKIIKLADTNELPHISFEDTPDGIMMIAKNKNEKESDIIRINLTNELKPADKCVSRPFIVSTVNLKIENDAYHVAITESGFAWFVSKNNDRRYMIVSELEG